MMADYGTTDTSLPSPVEIATCDQTPAVETETYPLPPWSPAVMVARSDYAISS